MRKSSNQKGFTLIELLIATSIFTFILLIATAGIIQIGQLYYKSINQAKIQDSIRGISDEMSRSVQFAKGQKTPVNTGDTMIQKFCLGDTVYTAFMDAPYKQPDDSSLNTPSGTPTGLWAEQLSDGQSCQCVATSCSFQATTQLLGENMRILKLNISQLSSGLDAWRVDLRLAYGDNDLLSHYNDNGTTVESARSPAQIQLTEDARCKSGRDGNSFCATAQLDTVVKKRLN